MGGTSVYIYLKQYIELNHIKHSNTDHYTIGKVQIYYFSDP
jgi:hypothetical protein